MAKGAGYGTFIAFVLSIMFGVGSQNGCYFAGYTWFLGNTDLHFLLLILRLQSRNLEIGIKKKSLGVMNGRCFATKTQRREFFQEVVVLSRQNELTAFLCIILGYYNHTLSILYPYSIYTLSILYLYTIYGFDPSYDPS